MSKDLVYRPTPFQRHQWRYHKKVENNAREAEQIGEERYENFATFSEEIHYRMFSDNPDRVEEPTSGSEIFHMLNGEIDKIPELDDLSKRCVGDERWSGIATTAIIDQILGNVPAPDERIEDPEKDEEVMRLLQQMIESAETDEDAQEIQNAIDALSASASHKKEKIQSALNSMDSTDVRNALRIAAQNATEEINQEEQMIDSFAAGTDIGTSRKANNLIARKLRSLVAGNDRIRRITELAGRLRRIAVEEQRQKPRRGSDEVTGVEYGDNLSRLVPSEALMMDDAFEMIFAKRYNEHALLNTELNKTPPKQQGPVVMLLDSSASMEYNKADAWAGAVALAFLDVAKKQKRSFALIHFGGGVRRIDYFYFAEKWSSEKIIEAISFFASDGGTNFMDPLNAAINLIREDGSFKSADIVMVTDGQASVSQTFLDGFEIARDELGFSVYSILVSHDAINAVKTCELFSDDTVFLNQALAEEGKMFKFFKKV